MTPSKVVEKMKEDPIFREVMAKKSFLAYCMYYKAGDFELKPAPFHKDLFRDLEGVKKYIAIMGFRGCAKTTILEAFAEWSMITGRSQFTVWIGATDDDAKESIANIKASIQENEMLIADFDIDVERKKTYMTDKWSEGQLTINGCTIIARSRGQKVRGRKHKKARIDLIIVDDLEDLKAVKTMEKRKATRQWFFSEVINATKQGILGKNVKVVVLGNLVHKDCMIARLCDSEDVEVIQVPLIDAEGRVAWPALYPNQEAIDAEKKKVMLADPAMGHIIWNREYLLKLIDEEDQIIKLEDIHRYDDSWLQRPKIRGGVGVDLAISEKETADYTAMTKGVIVENDYGERRLLIMKNNVKERINFSDTIHRAKDIKRLMPDGTIFFVEKVAYQQSAIEVMERNGLPCEPMTVTKDKRSRLISISSFIKSGMVMFPNEGCDDIINELLGFGIEEHDDQVDSLIHLVNGLLNTDNEIVFA